MMVKRFNAYLNMTGVSEPSTGRQEASTDEAGKFCLEPEDFSSAASLLLELEAEVNLSLENRARRGLIELKTRDQPCRLSGQRIPQ
jgi:hypothetical protein